MKVSQLISKLQELQSEHGDRLVIANGGGAGFYGVDEVAFYAPAAWPKWCPEWQQQPLIRIGSDY